MSARVVSGVLLAFAVLAVGCEGTDEPATDDASIADAGATDAGRSDAGGAPAPPATIGPAERPARLVVPRAHDGVTELPLVVLLHGYGATASAQDLYWQASATARDVGFYLVLPEGTRDVSGKQFWNATPACCDFGGTGVDDVGYLASLLDAAEAVVPVDTSRVYFVGHSNGSFMSFRVACELSERVAAIGGLAGADFVGDEDCVPSRPVSVLHVHGTADETIAYEGASLGSFVYPSARTAVLRWAARAGCDTDAEPELLEPLDLDRMLEGAETRVERWTGCDEGLGVQLWSIEGGSHIPAFNATWMPTLVEWLLRHRRAD